VDDASRATWVYLMKDRRETSTLLKNFVAMIKTQFGKTIKVVRSDNGSEFTSEPMLQCYEMNGMLHQTSYVKTP